jgi:hypothetical protein
MDSEALRPEIFNLYSSNERKFNSNPEWLRDLLSKVLRGVSAFIVVDGLDELDEKCRGRILPDLLHMLESCNSIKLLVSSREDSDLEKQLTAKSVTQIRVQDNNAEDVKQYVKSACQKLVSYLRARNASKEVCSEVQTSSFIVVERSEGE